MIWRWMIPLPPRGLGQNSRVHWRDEAPLKRAYRRDVVEVIRNADHPAVPLMHATLTITARVCRRRLRLEVPRYTYHQSRLRPTDVMNMLDALKCAVDALQPETRTRQQVEEMSRKDRDPRPLSAGVILSDRAKLLTVRPGEPFFEPVEDWAEEGVIFELAGK